MVIDIHTHVFPEKIAPAAIKKLELSANIKAVGDGTIEDLLRQMKQAGVDISAVSSVATSPRHVTTINRNLFDMDAIVNIGAMHPDFSDFESELKFLKQNNVEGIKLHPEYQDFFVDDEKVFGLYRALQQNDMFVLFHAGVDLSFNEPYHAQPKMLRSIAKKFPHLKIVAGHYGALRMWDEVLKHLAGLDNVWFDTAFCAGEIEDDIFYKILNKHSAKRVLMATDWPWIRADETIKWLKNKKLSSTDFDNIMGENPRKLLKI